MSRLATEELAGIISRFSLTLVITEFISVPSLKNSAIEAVLPLSVPAKKDKLAFWPSKSTSKIFFPLEAISQAKLKHTEVFPTPPFSLMKVIILATDSFSPFRDILSSCSIYSALY